MEKKIKKAKIFLLKELRDLKLSQEYFEVGYINKAIESYEVLLDYIKDLEENSKALKVLTDDMKRGRLVYISNIKKKIDSIFE